MGNKVQKGKIQKVVQNMTEIKECNKTRNNIRKVQPKKVKCTMKKMVCATILTYKETYIVAFTEIKHAGKQG